MSVTRKSLIVAAAAAATFGLGAPAASAYAQGDDHDINSGLVNVNDNNVPIQACGNTVPVNVLGVQVPVNDVNGALGLGLLGSAGTGTTVSDDSCEQGGNQAND